MTIRVGVANVREAIDALVEKTSGQREVEITIESDEPITMGGRDGDVDHAGFHKDSNTLRVVSVMYDHDTEWVDSGDIKEVIREERDIPAQRVSQLLYELRDRDLIESTTHPTDGRKRLYKLTEKGIASYEAHVG